MKYLNLFFLSALVLMSACRKNVEVDSGPCGNMKIDETRLMPEWKNMDDFNTSIHPAVFNQQVVFSRMLDNVESELLGYNGSSGELLWKSNVPVPYLAEGGYQQRGSKLYFVGEYATSLLSFDVATQQLTTIWTLPTPGYISSYMAVEEEFAICAAAEYTVQPPAVEITAYMINLHDGKTRELVRYVDAAPDFLDSGILDPRISVTEAGDTIFCFVKAQQSGSDPVSAQFVSVNVTNGNVVEGEVFPELYRSDRGNLVVQGGRAWFLVGQRLHCLDVTTGKELWHITDEEFRGNQLVFTSGKILIFGTSRRAYDAMSGVTMWEHSPNGYRERKHANFVRNGQMYMIQDLHLQSIDLETGCLTGDHALPADIDVGLDNMAIAPDGKKIYVLGYRNFLSVSLPK